MDEEEAFLEDTAAAVVDLGEEEEVCAHSRIPIALSL